MQADWVVGVDVGGTFTDFAARHLGSGRAVVHKRPSTPDDPSEAVLAGLEELKAKADLPGEAILRLGHGTTVATNALLQRRGARVGVVTTAGFRDLLEIGRQVRPKIYDLQVDAPPPLAARPDRLELRERIGPDGAVVTPLTDAALKELAEDLARLDACESVAVCFLFSFLNPAHEQAAAEVIRRVRPDLFVSLSSAVQPEFREYERFSTTTINAFLQPGVSRYLERLKAEVAEAAPNARFGIFQSSGGLMSVDRAAEFPVRTALSGPAAGVVGAAGAAGLSGIGDVITLDMGGTSTDVCLIRQGRADVAHMRDIAGFRIRLPMVDIHTVGAGGGSLAHVGPDGLMKVGPQSAGAVPGPACYDKGGTEPTVSDANVVLGRLPRDLAGGLVLREDLARDAVARVADRLGVTLERAARGIVDIVNANMVRAIGAVSVERGHDPRGFVLMPFGGAGGLHAADVAQALGITRILVPGAPGILCAEGLIVADLEENFVTTCRTPLDGDLSAVAAAVDDLAARASAWAAEEGGTARFALTLDMRYVGQNYELPVPATEGTARPALPGVAVLREGFLNAHEQSYGHADPEAAIEIMNLRLRAVIPLAGQAAAPASPEGPFAPVAHQPVWFDDDTPFDTPVYDRTTLPAGTQLHGPAILTQFDSTTLVPPGTRVEVDAALNLILEIGHG